MERVYAVGVTCIEYIQVLFADSESFFEVVNDLSDPNNVLEVIFPLVSIVDSVFAAQLCMCIAFGTWLNAVLKWWFLEDRPYWWIRETDFYGSRRPVLRQTTQTCETGPGCPSGHCETTAMLLLLVICWISHVMNDRKLYVRWWKRVVIPLCGAALGAVMLARMFVATHFPHQVLLGALIGAFLAPALCIYVIDPYIWRYGYHEAADCKNTRLWHIISAALTVVIGLVTYLMLRVFGLDPLWTVKLAFRWCEHPDTIRVSTTPMYALVHSTGHLLGWALCVTPEVTKYRHYTKDRSLIVSGFATAIVVYTWKYLQSHISGHSASKFYATHFFLCVLRPIFYLRAVPALAMWPYHSAVSTKKKN